MITDDRCCTYRMSAHKYVYICVITGAHRSLGQKVSKVRSLKLDERVWTDDLIRVRWILCIQSVCCHSYIWELNSCFADAIMSFSFRMMHNNLIMCCQVFLLLGNGKANQFWGANIPPSESLCSSAHSEQRLGHITAKYKDGKYCRYHTSYGQQDTLNSVSQLITNAK